MTTELPVDIAEVLGLKTLRAFSELVPEDLTGLAALGVARELEAGETLPAEAAAGRTVRFLLRGRIAVGSDPASREVNSGEWIDGIESIAGVAGTAAVAIEPSRVFEIDRAEFLELLENEFELLLAVFALVASTAGAMLRGRAQAQSAPPSPGREVDFAKLGLAEKLHTLRGQRALHAESVHTLGRVALVAEPLAAEPNARLWSPEDPADAMLVLLSGVLETRNPATGGTRHVGPGGLVGALECLAGGAYELELRAATPVQALRIERDAFLDILEDAPEVAVDGMVRLCNQIAALPHVAP